MSKEPIVKMKNIVKDFPGVRALDGVHLEILPGEVHALVGENGAGKSTILKILMGVHEKTEGTIYVDGKEIDIKSPLHAQSLGLGAVYQDINLAQHLSVAENFFMGELPKTKFRTIDFKKMHSETARTLEGLDVFVDPKAIINTLSIAQQEMVSIGKVMHQNAKVVIFDEPTALLTNEETKQLFSIIDKLKSEGVGILYVSHRMEEIFKICDRVTVFKDGEWVNTVAIDDTNEDDLISMMVGRKVVDMYNIEHTKPKEVVLKVENISREGDFENIDFEVRRGEIFGMFGLVGSGRTEVVRSVFGADPIDSGKVTFLDKLTNFKSPSDGIKAGIALLPENRKEQGLALGLSIADNTNIVAIDRISQYGLVNNTKGLEVAKEFCDKLRTKTPSVNQLVKNLSGGNQQKVVISKWLAQGSDLFIFDEPTVGVDVGAKVEIYKVFETLLKEGKTIIIISSYLPEVMGLADRMLIMHEGKQMTVLDRNEFNDEKILRLASGIKQAGKE